MFLGVSWKAKLELLAKETYSFSRSVRQNYGKLQERVVGRKEGNTDESRAEAQPGLCSSSSTMRTVDVIRHLSCLVVAAQVPWRVRGGGKHVRTQRSAMFRLSLRATGPCGAQRTVQIGDLRHVRRACARARRPSADTRQTTRPQ